MHLPAKFYALDELSDYEDILVLEGQEGHAYLPGSTQLATLRLGKYTEGPRRTCIPAGFYAVDELSD
jgi:hypothetical protein